jgi:hypothetical protein
MKQKAFPFRRCASAVFLLLSLDFTCRAQNKPFTTFEIGVSFVNHTSTSPWAHRTVSSIDSFPSTAWWDLIDLGITMPGMIVTNVNDVFPRNLIDSAGKYGLHLALISDSLGSVSRWERRYFQVEAKEDFQNNEAGTPAHQEGFQLLDLRYDLHRKDFFHPDAMNGILFRQGKDAAGSAIFGLRRSGALFVNGRYYVTLRLGAAANTSALPPNDSARCITLRLLAGGIATEWAVPGSAFYAPDGSPKHAFEFLPENGRGKATVVLRADTTSRTKFPYSVRYRIEQESAAFWGQGMWGADRDYPRYGTRYLPNDSTMNASDYDVEIVYEGRGDVFVDAVCFSDPQGYGFFVGDDCSLPDHRGGTLRTIITKRLVNLGAAHGGALRFLELAETGPDAGSLTSMNYVAALARKLAGSDAQLMAYHYGGPTRGGYDELAGENYYLVSGFYYDAIWNTLHRPEHPNYYHELFDNVWGSFWYGARWTRPFSRAYRAAYDTVPFNFMPSIANNGFSFKGGWRWPVSPGDVSEQLREPTAAELRLQVNFMLCYGAKSINYYHWSSVPAVETADTVSADGLFTNRGVMGFINLDGSKRRMDVWGQDKWDSTSRFNKFELRPMGDSLLCLRWENAVSIDDPYTRDREALISRVVSERLGLGADLTGNTYVELARFSHPRVADAVYLFVVNKRTDSTGDRHITVKLTPGDIGATAWKVTNVFTRQTWTAKALWDATPDTAGGFTDFVKAGGGALFRLEPVTPYVNNAKPSSFALAQNYPNPFSSRTSIVFALPHAAAVTLKLYDALGREVYTLLNQVPYDQGTHVISVDMNTVPGLSSGVYVYHIKAGEFSKRNTMMRVKK